VRSQPQKVPVNFAMSVRLHVSARLPLDISMQFDTGDICENLSEKNHKMAQIRQKISGTLNQIFHWFTTESDYLKAGKGKI